MKKFFITGIGTDIGKTVVSAIITEAIEADYWKPVQAGNLDVTDSDTVRRLISNNKTIFHPEAYRLQMPASPHQAAAAEGISITPDQINLPVLTNNLVIEGAGGLMVPLNNNFLMLDLISGWDCDVILVSKNYLGSINHTLMSIDSLQRRQVPIAGIVFNGEPNPASEDFIISYSGLRRLPTVAMESELNPTIIKQYATRFKPFLL